VAPPGPPLFPYTPLFRSARLPAAPPRGPAVVVAPAPGVFRALATARPGWLGAARVSTRPTAGLRLRRGGVPLPDAPARLAGDGRSEEHTSELQSRFDLVC